MRYRLILLVWSLYACKAFFLALSAFSTPNPAQPLATASTALATLLSPTYSPSPALTPSHTPTPIEPTATRISPVPTSTPAGPFQVRFHPDGPLYVGDLVSIEVIAAESLHALGLSAQAKVEEKGGTELIKADFGRYGIAGRTQATLLWAWNTAGLSPGNYTLSFSVLPGGPSWTETVTLLPGEEVPYPEPQARWAIAESDCCLVYYITGTPAERDLSKLLEMVDDRTQQATQRLGITLVDPVKIVFVPRVRGHGGFASYEIYISYLDRNYAGSSSDIVFHHELVHILDGRLGGKLRPDIFVEGLAVYLTGGHFKPEPLMPRAAALLPPEPGCADVTQYDTIAEFPSDVEACGFGWYTSISPLMDKFYFFQHETSYLEAGALVEYMVETWGWEAFSRFYRDIPMLTESGNYPQSQAVDTALRRHFGISLGQLEQGFLDRLKQVSLTPDWAEDVRLTVNFYDTLRRYQQMLDPSAYFMTAWLPDGEEMRERGIVADALRRPTAPENLALETLLVAADEDLRSGNYAGVERNLEAVNAVLDHFAQGVEIAFNSHPLAADYLNLVRSVLAAGYQPHRIEIEGDIAQVWVTRRAPELLKLKWQRGPDGWVLVL